MTKSTKTATSSKVAKSVKTAPVLQFNMEVAADFDVAGSDLDLMASMMDDLAGGDEIIETSVDDGDLMAASVAEIEKAEAVQALYADDEIAATETISAADTPKDTVDVTTKPAKKVKTPKVKAEKVAKTPAEPKEPRITYVGHTTSEVLTAKLGGKKDDLLILEVADAALDAEALAAKQDLLLSEVDNLAKKVGEKAVILFGWLKNGGKLNEVMARAFTVLAKDGQIINGPKGNLQVNLSDKYSPGTAASQANQMAMLFPFLAVTKREKGVMVANPDSLIFMKAKAELGLA